jgi:hypothetical protein
MSAELVGILLLTSAAHLTFVSHFAWVVADWQLE